MNHSTLSSPNHNPPFYIGVDIAKREIVVALDATPLTFANSRKGWLQLRQAIGGRPSPRLVMEASGGYERPLLLFALQHSIAASVVQAGRVRHFARAHRLHAKTDAIDAALLSRFGREARPPAALPLDGQREALRRLLARRTHVIALRVSESSHAASPAGQGEHPLPDAQHRALLECLEKQVEALDAAPDEIIAQDTQLHQMDSALQSVKGVGPQASRILLAALPELGRVSRGQIASLAGLAPFNRDSGGFQGKRFIMGGRAQIRKVLYMAAIAASRHNPVLAVSYQRLREAGKPGKVAIVATSRKLLSYLNSLMAEFYKKGLVKQTA